MRPVAAGTADQPTGSTAEPFSVSDTGRNKYLI